MTLEDEIALDSESPIQGQGEGRKSPRGREFIAVGEDGRQHTFEIRQHFSVPETDDPEALARQEQGALLILEGSIRILTAVELDDQPSTQTGKSTTNGAIACWRRNFSPDSLPPRSLDHRMPSASVCVRRSRRAESMLCRFIVLPPHRALPRKATACTEVIPKDSGT